MIIHWWERKWQHTAMSWRMAMKRIFSPTGILIAFLFRLSFWIHLKTVSLFLYFSTPINVESQGTLKSGSGCWYTRKSWLPSLSSMTSQHSRRFKIKEELDLCLPYSNVWLRSYSRLQTKDLWCKCGLQTKDLRWKYMQQGSHPCNFYQHHHRFHNDTFTIPLVFTN